MFIESAKGFEFKTPNFGVVIKRGRHQYDQAVVDELMGNYTFRMFIDAGVVRAECDILDEFDRADRRNDARGETVQDMKYSGTVAKLQEAQYADRAEEENIGPRYTGVTEEVDSEEG